jgi:hypothetical protein
MEVTDKILIGSSAIKHHFADFTRQPKDVDYMVLEQTKRHGNTEYLVNPIFKGYPHSIIMPNDLCTLKASHLFWNINWDKHMYDLQFLLKKGCKIDVELFWRLYDYWNAYHGKNKRSDLKMTKDDFFNNAINYDEHEHDSLHEVINKNPIYKLILKDGKEVELCENKYNNLTHDQKLDLIREEVMVMAYERYRALGYKIAYNRMLKKFIISHAPKFTLIFILENYIELTKCNINFIKTIQDGINNN